jgi:DNA-binding LacI/PurR family transcriptional regulator
VRPATREKVQAAIKKLGYRPNGAARALVQGRQPIVGVIARNTTEFGYTQMLLGIEQRAREAGHVVAIAVIDPHDPGSIEPAVGVMLGQPIVGAIVLDYDFYDRGALSEQLAGVPVATVAGLDDAIDVPRVVVDDRRAARELTEHLLGLGHRTVHHVGVPGAHGRPNGREVGWREALDAAGAVVPEVVLSDWSIASGRAAGSLLAQDGTVTAVVCGNDEIACAVMRSLHDAGRRVPDDVSVVGIDDHPLAEVWVPGLTTYRLDFVWAGSAAVDLLLEDPRRAGRVTAPSSGVVLRGTSAPPR